MMHDKGKNEMNILLRKNGLWKFLITVGMVLSRIIITYKRDNR